ncbi:hypothetical protein ACHQM5_008317 [Ranunculus cassubicifolius]
MGIARTLESTIAETLKLRRFLLSTSPLYQVTKPQSGYIQEYREFNNEEFQESATAEEEKVVCVTSGISFLGLAIVNRLLHRGYSIRIAVDNEEEMEKLREIEFVGGDISAVIVKVTDIDSLCEAFSGCHGVFHTSAFIDPAGVSGYTKYMAKLEVRACENVMEACARTESVRRCVFTSSLLACVWRDNDNTVIHDRPPVIVDHFSWSEETICREKKLWFALGKTMAERSVWRMAENSGLKLATICPGLLTGPKDFPMNSMSSVAYLKGAREMYAAGLLATSDVNRVAEAHVCLYEALRNTAHGRYICFDRVIKTEDEAVELARDMGMPCQRISGDTRPPTDDYSLQFKLCNRKLSRLMSRQSSCY